MDDFKIIGRTKGDSFKGMDYPTEAEAIEDYNTNDNYKANDTYYLYGPNDIFIRSMNCK